MTGLTSYLTKRNFDLTPEPSDAGQSAGPALRYSIQNHRATRLHWDLRLEWEGVLLSWAITRGPSFDPSQKRLAVRTEDHPLSYLDFEGEIPKDNYGAGTVMLWDIGWWQQIDPVGSGLRKGHLRFRLHGQRMTGEWNMIRMKKDQKSGSKRENWLLIKVDDEAAGQADPVKRYGRSIRSGRTFDEIKQGKPPVPHVHTGKLPKPVEMQLAVLTDTLADPTHFWHELKLDGYRAQIALGQGGPRVYTRSGLDWTDRFASLLPHFRDIECDAALIDGEIVAGAGLQGFSALQKAIKAEGPFGYVAFDLIALNGSSFRHEPLTERRKALEGVMQSAPPLGALVLSPVVEGDPTEAFEMICANGGEGLIAKRRDAPYRAGRGEEWVKIKCQRRAEFVIVGWQPSTAKGRPFASLLLAARKQGELHYVGKVGTGFDQDALTEIFSKLQPLQRKTAPFKTLPTEVNHACWVTPELVAEVNYSELTAQGRLRHASYLGLREDKPAQDVNIDQEIAMELSSGEERHLAGVRLTSGTRKIFEQPTITKADLAEYYEQIAPQFLQECADHPLGLLRLPEGMTGERFFQKHPGKGFPDAVKTMAIAEKDGDEQPYAYVTDAAGLIGAVQMGVVEFHLWGARRDRLERPDRLVFDLDPDDAVTFAQLKSAAVDLRDQLAELGVASWALLTGGKGIHVVVPLRRTLGWETSGLFSKGVALLMSHREPDRFVAEASKAKRKGKIYIDWRRNERGATAIAPFSVRARPGAPVAVPVSWDELSGMRKAGSFGIKDALERGWTGVTVPSAQSITQKVSDALSSAFDASKGD